MKRVRQLLSSKSSPSTVVTIEPASALRAAVHLLISYGIGGLPVVADDGTLVGFLAERDVVRAVEQDADAGVGHLRVSQVMRRPAPVCSADDAIQQVMSLMTRERLRHLVVLDAGRIAGVLSVGDLVKDRLGELETETGVLRDLVAAQRARI